MPSPQTLLPWLLGGAIGAAGIFQGLHWRTLNAGGDLSGLQTQLRIAGEENEMLKRENDSLRSLAQGGGEVAVPQDLLDRVEKALHLRFRSSPVIHRTTPQALRDRISAGIENRMGPAGIDDRQAAYGYIGWLRPEDELLSQLTAIEAVGELGWFDEGAGEGWMIDRLDVKNIPDQAALVKVLARILLHQHFPPGLEYLGDDAERGRGALHAGAAFTVEAAFYAEKAQSIGFMPMKEHPEREQLLATLSPFLQGLSGFPTAEGKAMANSLLVKGAEALHQALRQPPPTTRAVIYPGEPHVEPQGLQLPSTFEEPFLTESAGQLGLRMWLEALGDVGAASEIATAWRNDRYVLFPDGEAASAIMWDVELQDSDSTDALQALALNLAAALSWEEEAAKLGVVIESPEKRYLLVTRVGPTRIRFLNTASAATATALGTKSL